jgi:hypothetical protein
MGQLTKTVLGRISGRVGDVVFRQRAGKNYVSSRPGSYPATSDPVVLERRSNFGLTVGFASAVNSIPGLHALWQPYAKEGLSAYNEICSKNYQFVDNGIIDDRAMIVPAPGFEVTATSLELTGDELTAVFAVLGADTGIDDISEGNMYLAVVVHLSNPIADTIEQNVMMALLSPSHAVDLINPVTFHIPLDSVEGQTFDDYEEYKVFAALFTVNADGTPVHYSNTIIG